MQTATHRLLMAMDATSLTLDGRDAIDDFDNALDAVFDADTALDSAERSGRISTAWIKEQRKRLATIRAVLLAVHREQKQRNRRLDAEAKAEECISHTDRVLAYMQEYRTATVQEVVDATGICYQSAVNALTKLQASNKVLRIRRSPAVYTITDEPAERSVLDLTAQREPTNGRGNGR